MNPFAMYLAYRVLYRHKDRFWRRNCIAGLTDLCLGKKEGLSISPSAATSVFRNFSNVHLVRLFPPRNPSTSIPSPRKSQNMGRELQKAKARSSVSTVKAKNHGRTKAGRRKVDFLGNKAIAENWDRKQTVTQNYKRLGLSSRLNAATGGVEKFKAGKENTGVGVIAINRERREARIRTEEVKVERDEEGKIKRVVRPEGVHRGRCLIRWGIC